MLAGGSKLFNATLARFASTPASAASAEVGGVVATDDGYAGPLTLSADGTLTPSSTAIDFSSANVALTTSPSTADAQAIRQIVAIERGAPGAAASFPQAIDNSVGTGILDGVESALVPRTAGIGKSGYATPQEFGDAVTAKYQQLYDQGNAIVMQQVKQGLVENNNRAIGSAIDDIARTGLRDWLTNVEGISEGPGEIIQVNRRLYDPSGSGAYRIPDVYIPSAGTILDGSIASKSGSLPQIRGFWSYSNGANVTIIRPTSRITGPIQGSYGLVH